MACIYKCFILLHEDLAALFSLSLPKPGVCPEAALIGFGSS